MPSHDYVCYTKFRLPGHVRRPPYQQRRAGATIRGTPELAVSVAQPTVNVGETNSVTLQVTNDGDLDLGPSSSRAVVTTARNVRVEADAGGTPLTVETGTVAIGAVTENQPGSAPIAVGVPSDVEPGTYDIDVEVRYSHTYQQSGNVVYDRQETVDREVTVEVSDDARFEITNVTTDARVGDQGTLEAEVENVGADAASGATVTLESASAGLTFGQSPRDSARIGQLEPGEATAVTYDVAFAAGAPVREYALDGTVTFDTSEGYQRVDESPSASVRPGAEQRFSIDDVDSDLYVGEQGDLRGTVTNDGPATARNVVVQYAEESPNVVPVERSVAVGTLDPGESADFRLPIEVGGEAEAVARTADVAVQYRTADLERRAYQDLELLFDVAPERDRFDVAVADRTLETGGERTLSVEVTNNLNETVGDVEARLFTDDPIATGDTDTGYAQTIEPGETVTMTFDLSATGSATPGSTYPISFDFRYDDANGDSQLSDTVRVPIDVTESEGGGLPIGPIVVVLVVLAAGGAAVWYRRR
ncbi:COG1361 S-layer family protein [Halorubrum sp. AJ67]|uniref:COG1361 S-layer family protein n=1 Tax=Halorubrum sp. AJ67 TaxID=1173487 RepID=UPI001E3A40BC|nr:exo-alpha-sialidase [Halorubrum sp. AJ67]